MSDLQKLIGKRYPVLATNTRYFGPTLAQKQKGKQLKNSPDWTIPKKKPSLAVGNDGIPQKSPES